MCDFDELSPTYDATKYWSPEKNNQISEWVEIYRSGTRNHVYVVPLIDHQAIQNSLIRAPHLSLLSDLLANEKVRKMTLNQCSLISRVSKNYLLKRCTE